MRRDGPSSGVVMAVVVGVSFAFAAALALGGWSSPIAEGPNVVLIVTDDQSFSSLPAPRGIPDAMPFLQAQLDDPRGHWVWFPNAFVNTPLCCPSRATILTGQTSSQTGVERNEDGVLFRDASTLATWMQDRGFHTGLFGKYLNRYPFDAPPLVPPGWDEWVAKLHGESRNVYYDYKLSRHGRVQAYGTQESDYLTDVLTVDAVDFIDAAPVWQPFFLYYAPTSPHSPWVPAPRYETSFDAVEFPHSESVAEEDVEDKPEWIQVLPKMTDHRLALLAEWHRREFETLRATDDGVRAIMETLAAEGKLDETVIIFLSDNGYSYGEHRVVAKTCPYDECARVPFAIRYPGADAHTAESVVSNLDVSATIAAAVKMEPQLPQAGVNLLPAVAGRELSREGVLLEWAGDATIPEYWGYRTEQFLYVEYPATEERELYDQAADPAFMTNLAEDPGYRQVRQDMANELRRLVPPGSLDA